MIIVAFVEGQLPNEIVTNYKMEESKMTTQGTMPNNVILPTSIFASLVGSGSKKIRKELQSYLEQGKADFTGITLKALEPKEAKRIRVKLPDNVDEKKFKVCTSCYNNAMAEGKTHDEAVQAAIHPMTDFGKLKGGKIQSYCKPCASDKVKRYKAKLDADPERAKLQLERKLDAIRKKMEETQQRLQAVTQKVEPTKSEPQKAKLVKKAAHAHA